MKGNKKPVKLLREQVVEKKRCRADQTVGEQQFSADVSAERD